MKRVLFSILFLLTISFICPTKSEAIGEFKSTEVFPTWGETVKTYSDKSERNLRGVIGKNEKTRDGLRKGESRSLLYYIPRLTDIFLKFIAPVIAIMFIFVGIRFIYAGDTDEQLEASKKFFQYALMGTILVMLGYSIMKSTYFLLKAPKPPESPTSESFLSKEAIKKYAKRNKEEAEEEEERKQEKACGSKTDPELKGECSEKDQCEKGETEIPEAEETEKPCWQRDAFGQEAICCAKEMPEEVEPEKETVCGSKKDKTLKGVCRNEGKCDAKTEKKISIDEETGTPCYKRSEFEANAACCLELEKEIKCKSESYPDIEGICRLGEVCKSGEVVGPDEKAEPDGEECWELLKDVSVCCVKKEEAKKDLLPPEEKMIRKAIEIIKSWRAEGDEPEWEDGDLFEKEDDIVEVNIDYSWNDKILFSAGDMENYGLTVEQAVKDLMDSKERIERETKKIECPKDEKELKAIGETPQGNETLKICIQRWEGEKRERCTNPKTNEYCVKPWNLYIGRAQKAMKQ